jgi:hypothetical protein
MTAQSEPLAHRRLRAPREHGQALFEPPLSQVPRLLASNQAHSQSATRLLPNKAAAREQMLETALTYTRQYRDVPDRAGPAASIVMAGHQPELFHAGVWLKNFVLSELGRGQGAMAINLIADSDGVHGTAIRVPAGTAAAPRVDAIPIDAAAEGIPYEERRILDTAVFHSFDRRVAEAAKAWIDQPLARDLWRLLPAAGAMSFNLGRVIAAARHRLEGEWGLRTLEVPAGIVYAQASFRQFALQLLVADAARFRETHNAALQEYRSVNHIRSRAHPVPDLAEEDSWHEVPLWIWSSEEPRRRRLFVRPTHSGLEITDRGELRFKFPRECGAAIEAWEDLEARGIKIRPRAILTTMYARLFLCDLFIHGIGGAKYDELTDAIIRRYFGIEPPAYLTTTATVQLPLDYRRTSAEEVRRAQHEVRELPFHAEQYVSDGIAQPLVARKRALLREVPARGAKKSWHAEIVSINRALAELAAHARQRLADHLARLTEQRRATMLLGSREFSFCLYPADFLRGLLLDLSRGKP